MTAKATTRSRGW